MYEVIQAGGCIYSGCVGPRTINAHSLLVLPHQQHKLSALAHNRMQVLTTITSHRPGLQVACVTRPCRLKYNTIVTSFMAGDKQQQEEKSVNSAKVLVSRRPSNAPALIKDEQQSLQRALQEAGLPQDGSVAEMSASAVQGVVSIIKKGVDKEEQDLVKLEGAMLLAEQLFHTSGGKLAAATGNSQSDPQSVDVWQPIFASAGGFPRLLYIPVPEYFDMHRALPDATAVSISSVSGSIDSSSSVERAANAAGQGGRINIITELGPLTTHFLGSCCWLDDTTFEYSINTVRLDLGARSISVGLGPFKLNNQLSFFLTTPEVACARSKLGGTMLLAAEPPQAQTYFDKW